MKVLTEYWPFILFLIGVIWKQIETHFKVINLQQQISDNESEIYSVKTELHIAMKEQNTQTNDSIKELTKATTELVTATKVMASQIEDLKNHKK